MSSMWPTITQRRGNRNPPHSTCGSRWAERHQQPSAPAQSVPQAGTLKNQAKSLEVRLEPDDAKVSRPVLRGGAGSNPQTLPDRRRTFEQFRR